MIDNEYLNRLYGLTGKVAVVTGGYGYLGSEFSKTLNKAGADVYVLGLDLEKHEKVFGKKSNIKFIYCNLKNSSDINNALNKINIKYGKLDLLINNAFYISSSGNPLQESDEDINKSLDGTVCQSYRVIKIAVPLLRNSTAPRIVNISSMYGSVSPVPEIYYSSHEKINPIFYGVGKAAIEQMTRYLATLLVNEGIVINAIAPGPFPDPQKNKNKKFIESLIKRVPSGRIGVPSDLSSALLFLCGEGAGFITGQVLHINGGWNIV